MPQTKIESAPAALPADLRDVHRLVARGRDLQAAAIRDAFRRLFRFLVGGCSLRGLRLPGTIPAGRQPCC